MGDSTVPAVFITERSPSVYRLWQIARAEGGSLEDIEGRYQQLLDQYGHREREFRW